MTEARAFAAMVSQASVPTSSLSSSSLSSSSSSRSLSLSSTPSTSAPPSPSISPASLPSSSSSLSSSSIIQHYLPFLSFFTSSRSTATSEYPSSSTSSSSSLNPRASCSTRTCLSYCCSTPSASSLRLNINNNKESLPLSLHSSSTSNLRPKNYYSRRQRHMLKQQNNTPSALPVDPSSFSLTSNSSSSVSTASHSDCGSDRDDLLQDLSDLSPTLSYKSLHRRSVTANSDDSTTAEGAPNLLSTTTTTTTTTTTITTTTTTAGNMPPKSTSSFVRSTTGGSASSPTATPSTIQGSAAGVVASSTSTSSTTTTTTSTSSPSFGLVVDGPYMFVFDVALSLYYPIRALILFVLGFVFSLVIDHLQTQHQLVQYPSNMPQLWDTASWLPPTCGASAVLIGTIYPLGDYLWWGKRVQPNGRDWSSVMRCMGGFIGVNYAASKLPWTSSIQVSCTLALISAALWFLFDRTFHGFMISLTVASMGTTVAYFLVLNGWYSFTRADFFGVGSWIPCILYSSSVCFGSIGRQLDVVPETWYHHAANNTSRIHLKSE